MSWFRIYRKTLNKDIELIILTKATEMTIEIELEKDNRWIAEIPELPGVMTYGDTREEAISKVEALALRVIADKIEHGEMVPDLDNLFVETA
jgi:predicted RNase H-like HicB family nuclease